jgi:hypothetical protein
LLAQPDAHEVQAQLDQAPAVRQQAESDLERATDLFQKKSSRHLNLTPPSPNSARPTWRRQRRKCCSATPGSMRRSMASLPARAPTWVIWPHGKSLLETEDTRHLRPEADVPGIALVAWNAARVKSLANL